MAGNISTNLPLGWADVQNVQANARQNFYGGKGAPYQGETLAPLNAISQQALQNTLNTANTPFPGLPQANAFNTAMITGRGMTPDLTRTAGYLTPFASGKMQEDPRLLALLDRQATQAGNRAATQFGGGHYGSSAIGAGLGTAITDANNATMLQSNEAARTRQLEATQMLGNLYGQGLGRAFQAETMMPTMNELRYDPAARIAGVGDFYQNRAQTEKDAQMAQYNEHAGFPWVNLNRYADIIQGTGRLGGTTFGKTSGPSQMQSTIGGALAGATLGGKLGTAVPGIGTGLGTGVGGVLGGLGGFFQ